MRTIFIFFGLFSAFSPANGAESLLSIYDRTANLITKNFYDRTFRGLDWSRLVHESRSRLKATNSDQKLKKEINTLLANLGASHTHFFSRSDQEYWALKNIFSGEIDANATNQIGAWFEQSSDQKWFVRNVFPGSPAEKAGLLSGDEVSSSAKTPFQPIDVFARTSSVQLAAKSLSSGAFRAIRVSPKKESFQRTMLNATQQSFKLFSVGNTRVAYFHLWAGTHDLFRDALRDAALKANEAADYFILDLRDGFGGAYPAFLDPFYNHDSEGKKISPVYTKPMIVLINQNVRSGKEWIANILQSTNRATLIGSQTKGYFLAGQLFEIVPKRFALFLAVATPPADAPKLEANGVRPDITVDAELAYSQGRDRILERAISYIREQGDLIRN